MKKRIIVPLAVAVMLFSACSSGQQTGETLLGAADFRTQISATPEAVVLDVRTPQEYAGGHLRDALNIDWNDSGFDAGIAELDKQKTYFVYCLAGGRSAAAAERMREQGFGHVVELQGGILKWREAGLPETKEVGKISSGNDVVEGMTVEEFRSLLQDERYVLVDFYAEWCGPCKKMKPFLDEIAADHSDKVKVVRIDVDKNRELASAMRIEALPTLQIVKNSKMIWTKVGYADKGEIMQKLP